jgi:hypothetical protein
MSPNVRLSVVAVILALVIVVGFVLSVPHVRDVREAVTPADASTTPLVTIKDAYKKGTHTLSGSVLAPDACATLEASASFASSTGAQIILDISMPPSQGMCLEVPTALPFSVTVGAPADTPITVRVNGAVATTTP